MILKHDNKCSFHKTFIKKELDDNEIVEESKRLIEYLSSLEGIKEKEILDIDKKEIFGIINLLLNCNDYVHKMSPYYND